MADAPYLVALALVEQQGEKGRTLASDEGPLKRAAGDESLLLVELPMELMSQHLPLLKANWLTSGDTAELLRNLKTQVIRGWRISIAQYEPVTFKAWC